MTWRIGGLFAGVGGLEMGLHAAGVGTTAWFSEVDKDASAVLAARFPGVPNHGDVTAIDWHRVEPVDVLVGGYPCQPFSFAGQRGGSDDARHLWPHFARALRVLRPRFAVLENVSGHLSLGFDAVLADLAEAGFDALWSTLRASDVGAPHRRERLFVVAADAANGDGWRGWLRLEVGNEEGNRRAEACDGNWDAAADAKRQSVRVRPGCVGAPSGAVQGDIEQRQRVRVDAGDGGSASADTDDPRPHRQADHARRREPDAARIADGADREGPATAWGAYAAAIARWEHVLGRAAPAPVDDRGRLNAGFSEWMMGFPEGWVTDVLARNPALRCIGNAVVPQVAAVVGAWLLEMAEAEAVVA